MEQGAVVVLLIALRHHVIGHDPEVRLHKQHFSVMRNTRHRLIFCNIALIVDAVGKIKMFISNPTVIESSWCFTKSRRLFFFIHNNRVVGPRAADVVLHLRSVIVIVGGFMQHHLFADMHHDAQFVGVIMGCAERSGVQHQIIVLWCPAGFITATYQPAHGLIHDVNGGDSHAAPLVAKNLKSSRCGNRSFTCSAALGTAVTDHLESPKPTDPNPGREQTSPPRTFFQSSVLAAGPVRARIFSRHIHRAKR